MSLIEYKDRHELPDEDAVVIFNHIPKTGGITLDHMLRRHYGEEKYQRVSSAFLLDSCSNQLSNGIRCIAGHAVNGIHKFLPELRLGYPVANLEKRIHHLFGYILKIGVASGRF